MTKVLFVSSGNSNNGFSIIKNQAISLERNGIEVSYFRIKGKRFKGYLKGAYQLHKLLKNNNFDVVHAHYSLSAFAATLAGAKPLVVSLMGSDVKVKSSFKLLLKVSSIWFWKVTIVKSQDMKNDLGFEQAVVIPNGVDCDKFKPLGKKKMSRTIRLESHEKAYSFCSQSKS